METKFNLGETVYVVAAMDITIRKREDGYRLYKFKISDIRISEDKVLYGDGKYNFPESIVGRTLEEAKLNIIENLKKSLEVACKNIQSLKLKRRSC